MKNLAIPASLDKIVAVLGDFQDIKSRFLRRCKICCDYKRKAKKNNAFDICKGQGGSYTVININEFVMNMLFSSDNKTLITWQQNMKDKNYLIKAYNIDTGKKIMETYLKVEMGYSGLWPLSVRCKSIDDGIYIMSIGYKSMYGKIKLSGSVKNSSEEEFFDQFGDVFVNNNTVFKFVNGKKTTICKIDNYFEAGVALSPFGCTTFIERLV